MSRDVYVCGQVCFVQLKRGLWCRVPRCVAFVKCLHCNAEVGELCIGAHGDMKSDVHTVRRSDYSVMLMKTGDSRARTANVITVEDKE